MTPTSEQIRATTRNAMSEPLDCDQLQRLTWAMLDDELSREDFILLNSLLISSEEARESYLDTIQLHTVLMTRFGRPSSPFVEEVVRQCAGLSC